MATYRHLNVFMYLVRSTIIYNASSLFCLFPAPREEKRGVKCTVIIVVPPAQRGIICAHADLSYYYIGYSVPPEIWTGSKR